MNVFKYKIRQRVIINGNHTGIVTLHQEGCPNSYRVEAFFEQYSGWYAETQLESELIGQSDQADAETDDDIDLVEVQDSADQLTELRQENQRLKEALNTAAGLLHRLEFYRCINTEDELFEGHLDHWRELGRWVVSHSSKLLNTRFNAGIDQ